MSNLFNGILNNFITNERENFKKDLLLLVNTKNKNSKETIANNRNESIEILETYEKRRLSQLNTQRHVEGKKKVASNLLDKSEQING